MLTGLSPNISVYKEQNVNRIGEKAKNKIKIKKTHAVKNRHCAAVEFSDRCTTCSFFSAPSKYTSPILRRALRHAALLAISSGAKPPSFDDAVIVSSDVKSDVTWLAHPSAMTSSARHPSSESSTGAAPSPRTLRTMRSWFCETVGYQKLTLLSKASRMAPRSSLLRYGNKVVWLTGSGGRERSRWKMDW